MWWVLLGGCVTAGKPTTKPPAPTSEVATPDTSDPKLIALADAIDPGPQAPLLDALPTWLKGQVDSALGPADGAAATAQVREALLAWDKAGSGASADQVARLISLGRALAQAERAVAAGSEDVELLLALTRAYALLDSPVFAAGQGIFQQVLQVAGEMAKQAASDALRAGQSPDTVDVAALMNGLGEVFARAGVLHRRTAALLLRRHGKHPEIARVLGRLADDAQRREQHAQAVELRRMAIERLGGGVTHRDFADLAFTCYRALDLACGASALTRAREFSGDEKATKEHAQRVARLEKLAGQAQRLRELGDTKELTPALERGHLLLMLDRFGEAEKLYEELRAAHPGDARPHGGLAKLEVARAGNFKVAGQHVAAGKPLANKDRDFYEVALGTVGVNFLLDALPRVMEGAKFEELVAPMLADLRGYAGGLRAFDPARATVVEAIEAAVREAVPAFLRGDKQAALKGMHTLLQRVAPVAAKYPDSPDAWRLRTVAANFAAAKPALAAVRAPLSPALAKDPTLQRTRVQAWLDVALAWEEAGELPAIAEAAAALPVGEGDTLTRTLQAATLALRLLRDGDRAAGAQAAEIYAALTRIGSDEQRAMALNNLAVVRARLGDPQAAIDLLAQSLTLHHQPTAALLNLAAIVLTLEGTQRSELADAFAQVARDGATGTLRLQAEAWRHTQAQKGVGDVEQARADFTAALTKERAAEIRGTFPLGRWGLLSTGSFQISFMYSLTTEFQIRNEVTTNLWLFLPSPDLDALLASKPGKR